MIILREIRPDYAIPVGVWQIREGIRQAMNGEPAVTANFDDALLLASKKTNVSKNKWLLHAKITNLIRQKTLSEFF